MMERAEVGGGSGSGNEAGSGSVDERRRREEKQVADDAKPRWRSLWSCPTALGNNSDSCNLASLPRFSKTAPSICDLGRGLD
jgi:hypothetical protein